MTGVPSSCTAGSCSGQHRGADSTTKGGSSAASRSMQLTMLGYELGCFVHNGSDVRGGQDDSDGLGLCGQFPHLIQVEPGCVHMDGWAHTGYAKIMLGRSDKDAVSIMCAFAHACDSTNMCHACCERRCSVNQHSVIKAGTTTSWMQVCLCMHGWMELTRADF